MPLEVEDHFAEGDARGWRLSGSNHAILTTEIRNDDCSLWGWCGLEAEPPSTILGGLGVLGGSGTKIHKTFVPASVCPGLTGAVVSLTFHAIGQWRNEEASLGSRRMLDERISRDAANDFYGSYGSSYWDPYVVQPTSRMHEQETVTCEFTPLATAVLELELTTSLSDPAIEKNSKGGRRGLGHADVRVSWEGCDHTPSGGCTDDCASSCDGYAEVAATVLRDR